MKIKVKKLDIFRLSEQEEKDWNIILQYSEDATIFHTPEWVRLLAEETGADSRILIAYDNSKPVGIFPYYIKKTSKLSRYARTTMFETPYGGPIAYTDIRNEIISLLIKKHHQFFKICGSEIILPPNYDINPFIKNKYLVTQRETMILDLNKSEEELWNVIGPKNRNMIRKAKKNDVKITENGLDSIADLYNILYRTYKRLGLKSPADIIFYEHLLKTFLPKQNIKLIFTVYAGKPVAFAIILLFKKKLLYWEAGSDREFWKVAPNNLIQWYIIAYGSKMGFKYYDMLHFSDKEGNAILSLKKFKERFGARETPYYIVKKNFPLNYLYKVTRIPRYFKRLWEK